MLSKSVRLSSRSDKTSVKFDGSVLFIASEGLERSSG